MLMKMLVRLVLILNLSLTLTGCREPALNWPGAVRVPLPKSVGLREPSWSPDGNSIVVASFKGAKSDIGPLFVVDVNSGKSAELGQYLANYEPHWSPDGRLVAHSSLGKIRIVDLSNKPSFSELDGGGGDWSPDGQRFVVYAQRHITGTTATFGLNVIELSTGSNTEIFSVAGNLLLFGGLRWSPTGDQIAFSFGSAATGSSLDDNRDVYVINPDGTGLTIVASTSADEFDPSWSPDGNWLVFISNMWVPDKSISLDTIMFTRADGSCSIPALSAEGLTGVDWSSSGEKLAVTYKNQLYIVGIVQTFGKEFSDLEALCGSQTNP